MSQTERELLHQDLKDYYRSLNSFIQHMKAMNVPEEEIKNNVMVKDVLNRIEETKVKLTNL